MKRSGTKRRGLGGWSAGRGAALVLALCGMGIAVMPVPVSGQAGAGGASSLPPSISEFLPQGRVSGIEAVQLRFSGPATAFGDAAAAAPVVLACDGPVPQGQGRWLDDMRWTYVFEHTLPAGVSCTATANSDYRDLNGQALVGDFRFAFDTGAPAVSDMRPYPGMVIDEEQVFILQFDGPVDAQAVAQSSHCAIDGLAEKIPVEAVGDEHLDSLMQAAYLPPPGDPATVALLRCARVLPPETQMRLEIGPGIRAQGQADTLPGSSEPRVLEYEVRPPFMATLSCTRERAGRPCLPVASVTVNFSAPVPQSVIHDIRLQVGDTLFQAELSEEENFVSYLSFPGPFPPKTSLTLSLPTNLRDDAGRELENAARFPMKVEIADYPPLAKFASGTFGVIERFAHAQPGSGSAQAAAVPVTLRHVEAPLSVQGMSRPAGQVAGLRSVEDREVLRWYARLQRLDTGRWSAGQIDDILAGRAPRELAHHETPRLDVRSVSLLQHEPAARRLALPEPPADTPRPFEVIGIPLDAPGFHVLEIASPALGASLLEEGGAMYVRTGVLLTNLSLHLKQGRDDLLVWVTTLADAQPVQNADIAVLDCHGRPLARGRTDAAGLWHHLAAVEAPQYCEDTGLNGLFVSARISADHPQAYGSADYVFVMSDWDRGIENWRFNVPTAYETEPERLTHTVFDRSLFRAGETVSMKHYLREESRDGLKLPSAPPPDRLLIIHQGSAQRHELALQWEATPSGGLAAISEFQLPESARLGSYAVRLTDADHGWYGSSGFRVEEFRLPLLSGQLLIKGQESGPPDLLVAPDRLEVGIQLAWLSGGAAAGQPVRLSALAEDDSPSFASFEEYRFSAPPEQPVPGAEDRPRRQVFLDSVPATLDAHGMATVKIETVPAVEQAQRLVFEADFSDPNGEVQTLSQTVAVWPSAVQAGLKAESWARAGKKIPVSLLALGTDGRPRAGVAMQLQVVERKTYTVRQRMVGGFYRYDSHIERQETGTVCSGDTGPDGRLECTVSFDDTGEFELVAVAQDQQGRRSRAHSRLWVSGAGESWFGGADDDRIDLIPAKQEWAVGEVAEFQVQMPFREALALVSVEREGVLWAETVKLEGSNPTIRIPVSPSWGPNAYISVLVLRGRLYELPWQSLFDWGWRQPQSWLQAWSDNPGDTLVSSTVDLAKPGFRLGLAELKVSGQADRLQVALTPQQDVLQVREATRARIKVSLPDGTPAAFGSIAFAVVDEALLELAPNDSWALYEAMHPRRSLAVSTATSQLEVVGRRHYGRKAVAAGGGGGSLPTRQLFDTLLSWQPQVALDAQGEAEVEFRMNDALSRFRLVVLADYGAAFFGSATAAVVTRQDLQLVSGLPPIVRGGDHYQAVVTVRNGTQEVREIQVSALQQHDDGSESRLPTQVLELPAGASASVKWDVQATDPPWPAAAASSRWRFQATDGTITDSLTVEQRTELRLPVTTVQASLLGLAEGEAVEIPIQPPAAAQRNASGVAAGGIALDLSSSLVGNLEGVRDWWRAYPYTCLEQTASQAMALGHNERWSRVLARFSTHMDEDGLLRYFPGTGPGSEVLTAYLISAFDDARRLGLQVDIPEHDLQRMLDGLQAFAQGRITRESRLSGAGRDARRLMAMEALARHGRVDEGMLSSLSGSPEQWPTPSVIDWLSVRMRLPSAQGVEQDMVQARHILISRMTVSGTAMVFSDTPQNTASGLMVSRATSQARLMLAVMRHPAWQRDLPLIAQGLLGLQRHGHWAMTTENLLGTLALVDYSRRFEGKAASGALTTLLAGEHAVLDLPPPGQTRTQLLAWPAAPSAGLQLKHEGQGRAWVGLRAQAQMAVAAPHSAGYRLERRVVPVQRARADVWSRGDVYRVELEIHARDSASWVVLNDPVPAGAAILGSGLGRDTVMAQSDGPGHYPPAFIERSATAYRAYFDYLPAGRVRIAYTVRLNAMGEFGLPPTRVEALYRPDLYGVFPNEEGLRVEEGRLDQAVVR